MRWLFLGLLVLGVGFGALMLLAPGGGGPKPPNWAEALGRTLSGLAPRVDHFADGSSEVALLDGETLQRVIATGTDRRILTLRLAPGAGPVSIRHECLGTPCKAETLCLGARRDECASQDDFGPQGAFVIGAGGAQLHITAWAGNARLQIVP